MNSMAYRNKKRRTRKKGWLHGCEVVVRDGLDVVRFRGQSIEEVMKIVDIKLRGQKRRKVKW